MNTAQKIAQLRREFVQSESEQAMASFDAIATGKAADSPIESLAIAAMLCNGYHAPASVDEWRATENRFAKLHLDPKMFLVHEEFGELGLQVSSDLNGTKVRFDMVAIVAWTEAVIVIEYDGHDFHERTREQARRDKSRDRLVTLRGWEPVRFTGAEVYEDPVAPFDHIVETYSRKAQARGR